MGLSPLSNLLQTPWAKALEEITMRYAHWKDPLSLRLRHWVEKSKLQLSALESQDSAQKTLKQRLTSLVDKKLRCAVGLGPLSDPVQCGGLTMNRWVLRDIELKSGRPAADHKIHDFALAMIGWVEQLKGNGYGELVPALGRELVAHETSRQPCLEEKTMTCVTDADGTVRQLLDYAELLQVALFTQEAKQEGRMIKRQLRVDQELSHLHASELMNDAQRCLEAKAAHEQEVREGLEMLKRTQEETTQIWKDMLEGVDSRIADLKAQMQALERRNP